MRYIFLLLFAPLAFAVPTDNISKPFPIVMRYFECGKIVKIIHTISTDPDYKVIMLDEESVSSEENLLNWKGAADIINHAMENGVVTNTFAPCA